MIPALSSILSRVLLDRSNGHRAKVLRAFDVHGSAASAPEENRLADLLNHAASSVPFYRECIPSRKVVASADARDVLRSLPVVKRADFQGGMNRFLAVGAAVAADDATGGSSGTPMQFLVDHETQVARESSLMWADSLAGWKMGEKIAMLWGSDRDVSSASKNLRLALRWWIDNRRWYNAFEMGADQMRSFHRAMSRFKPHLVVAYAGAVHAYAQFLESEGICPSYPLKAIVSSAESLPAGMRGAVEKVFGKPVFDRYGNREFGAIAAECTAHAGLHINTSDMIVEVLSEDPVNEPGPIVITYLRNLAMPFIRYDTGDLGLLSESAPCPCGRNSPRLARVVGRQSDMIRTSTGAVVHGEYFTHLLYNAGCVRQFQFVQESLDDYALKVVVSDRRKASSLESSWVRRIRERVGEIARVRVEYVDEIPVLASGKRRFTISMIR